MLSEFESGDGSPVETAKVNSLKSYALLRRRLVVLPKFDNIDANASLIANQDRLRKYAGCQAHSLQQAL